MNITEFEELKFEYEKLPSGYINIINTVPFSLNGCKTIICYKGGLYCISTNYKSIEDFLANANDFHLVDASSINPAALIKTKTQKRKIQKKSSLEPQTNQSLAEFLTQENDVVSVQKQKRTRRKKS